MDHQEDLLGDHEIFLQVQLYFLNLILPLCNNIGWTLINQTTDWRRALLQPEVLSTVCYYGYRECIDAARSIYRRWYLNPARNPIPMSLRSTVYCMVVREGSHGEFEFLWNRLKHELVPSETVNLLDGLACTKDRSRIVWVLNQHLNNESVIREQDMPRSISNVARSRNSNQITWIWMQDNWSQLFSKWGKTVRQLNDFKIFADSITDKGTVYRQFQLSLDKINASIVWNIEPIEIIGEISVIETIYNEDRDLYTIIFNRIISVNTQIMLTFNYLGQLNNDIDGLFLSSYVRSSNQVRRYFVASQMGPISARRALPCFDEPIFKATFSLTVEHEPQYRAWSNMPVENQTNLSSGLILTRFKKSIPMSSYLLALIVADFDCLTRHDTGLYRNVTMSVCAQPERKDDLYYALDIATKRIHDFEEQYQINYPLSKCDHIAVPNFDIPAMKNFGCILYSETRLLYNNQTSTSLNQQQAALIITHELSHQWFGNLVTPSWWKDFWLNKAFAEWMAYIATNKIHPDWNLYEQYIAQQWLLIMQDDAISFSHPISMQITQDKQIISIFDLIIYSKGSSLVRMMLHIMSENTFNRGISKYLRNHLYSTVEKLIFGKY
ncbi:unnamed protein product [Rotaria sp. Silwood1]|nr:unnamed protein product [Rotaria sp. Silwood1]CAF4747268.1 unnamed protein product [Rotaria sp. Silwood1]